MAETTANDSPAVSLTPCGPRGRINLRGDAGDPAFNEGVATVIGVGPPSKANTTTSGAGGVILWLGPDEWLIEVAAAAESELTMALESTLSDLHAAVVVVGDAHITLSLSGPNAVEVLAKGMTLDLDPDHFPAGCCARSLLAKAPVLLHRPGAEVLYEITVARSFADYVSLWLRDATIEYLGLP
ncbi:MAG: hypothetical protein OXG16_05700 [Rhodospirillales bacterium]|nr:hypothetical protein [Rhodospirillales bacterium]